ncbi:MAG: LTA synthase family protein [Tannerellaceae bacterium]|nr:LTA synthase family protein [Tannerellaceae bacterium]
MKTKTANLLFQRKGTVLPAHIAERGLILTCWICLMLKWMLFNLFWCLQTTFTSFSCPETYLSALLLTWILLLPLICFRAVKTTLLIGFFLDLFLVSNLMYFRTYYTAIPLHSYLLAGNLRDFTGSVWLSFRWTDLLFFFSTFLAGWIWWRRYRYPQTGSLTHKQKRKDWLIYTLILLLLAILFVGKIVAVHKGFRNAYESLQNANMHTCATPMYTLFGSLYYDHLKGSLQYTPEIEETISVWLASHANAPFPVPHIACRTNCILILAESLESWVLETTCEGVEITPHLNALLCEPSTLYAPHVLTQVKGGRSIDAQLLINTGLYPVESGSYSTQFPDTYYPSLMKAFKERYPGSKGYTLTVDKHIVWNQHRVSPAFGYDGLIDRTGFVLDEVVGPRKKVGDVSFLRQCADKIKREEVWNKQQPNFLQCITYSGHSPFILPDELKRISFSGSIPKIMNDYMTMANYTDYAIGEFIRLLKEQGIYDSTMIVITGDHEGLGDFRDLLIRSASGKGVVSEEQFTPLIILNSPVGMRYEEVMGQIDIYPTLLDLLGLSSYEWRGLGRSLLDPEKEGFAIDPHYQVKGRSSGITEEQIRFAQKGWEISDQIIRYDYWGNMNRSCE